MKATTEFNSDEFSEKICRKFSFFTITIEYSADMFEGVQRENGFLYLQINIAPTCDYFCVFTYLFVLSYS